MNQIAIKDIYAGMPDAKDEINSGQANIFLNSFIIPPGLPVDSLLDGKKYLILQCGNHKLFGHRILLYGYRTSAEYARGGADGNRKYAAMALGA